MAYLSRAIPSLPDKGLDNDRKQRADDDRQATARFAANPMRKPAKCVFGGSRFSTARAPRRSAAPGWNRRLAFFRYSKISGLRRDYAFNERKISDSI